MRIAIIGAGMAGLSAASALPASEHSVILFDKGRGPGGRMSTKRVETPLGMAAFDHGAQYFTARDQKFRRLIEDWAARNIVAPWHAAGADAWVGVPGMNAVIKAMASDLHVHWGAHVDRIERDQHGWRIHGGVTCHDHVDAVILAVPAEQAVPFLSLHDFAMAREAMLARSQPIWTAMFSFASPLPCAQDVLRDSGMIGWAARNSAKPERLGPEAWVVQARADWSFAHIDDAPGEITHALLAALSDALGIEPPVPVSATAHRWRYAMSAGIGLGALWNSGIGLGVCGDWLLGPRVESAWLSGQHLAQLIMESPPRPAHAQAR